MLDKLDAEFLSDLIKISPRFFLRSLICRELLRGEIFGKIIRHISISQIPAAVVGVEFGVGIFCRVCLIKERGLILSVSQSETDKSLEVGVERLTQIRPYWHPGT